MKTIQVPDGTERYYSDGTPDSYIEEELRKEFPPPNNAVTPIGPDFKSAAPKGSSVNQFLNPEQMARYKSELAKEGQPTGDFSGGLEAIADTIRGTKDPVMQQLMLDAYEHQLRYGPTKKETQVPLRPSGELSDPQTSVGMPEQMARVELNNMAPNAQPTPEQIKQSNLDVSVGPGGEFDPAKGMSPIEKLLVAAGGSMDKFLTYLLPYNATAEERTKLFEKFEKNLGGWGQVGSALPETMELTFFVEYYSTNCDLAKFL